MVTIIKLEIAAFGKLKNCVIELEQGINCLVGDNSAGKSTIAMFIKAMFYGLDNRKGDREEKEVKLYQPWNSSDMFGGSLIYQRDDKLFRITRMIGKSVGKNTVTHIELSTGRQLPTESIGQSLFGINSESFMRTVFVPQINIKVVNNEALSHKLTSMAEGGENNNYSKALTILDKAAVELKHKKGYGGSINIMQRQLDEIDNKLLANERDRRQVDTLQGVIDQTTSRHAQLNARKSELIEDIERLTADKVKTTPTVLQLEKMSQLEQAQLFVNSHGDYGQLSSDIAQCNALVADKTQLDKKRLSATAKAVVALCSVVMITLGVVLGVVASQWILAAILGIATVAFIVVLVVRLSKVSYRSVDITNKLLAIIAKYGYVHSDNYIGGIESMYGYMQQYNQAIALVAQLQPQVELLSDPNDIDKTLEVCKRELAIVEKEIEQNIKDNEQAKVNKQHIIDADNGQQLQEERLRLEERLSIDRYRHNTLDMCMRLINDAKTNLSDSYLPRLSKRCQELMNIITRGMFDKVTINQAFDITILEDGFDRDIEYFSQGIRELVVFCLRISLSEAVFEDNIPLLVLDDTFVNLDEDKFARIADLLQQLSANTQIIYLSCHKRRLIGGNVIVSM